MAFRTGAFPSPSVLTAACRGTQPITMLIDGTAMMRFAWSRAHIGSQYVLIWLCANHLNDQLVHAHFFLLYIIVLSFARVCVESQGNRCTAALRNLCLCARPLLACLFAA